MIEVSEVGNEASHNLRYLQACCPSYLTVHAVLKCMNGLAVEMSGYIAHGVRALLSTSSSTIGLV